jgi:alpha-mannosidase
LIANTNNHIFSIDYGISVRRTSEGEGIGVASSDLPLWSIGEPGLWDFSPTFLNREAVLFTNLYNNQWNTNWPLWVEGSWSATFKLWTINEETTEEEALFTPSWEFRQELLTGFAGLPVKNANLPVFSEGLSLSRKGSRITAFYPNPDAEQGIAGTLIRIWEQSGKSGNITVSLPPGSDYTQAHPVNLRGEESGTPVKVTENEFIFNLKAYSHASFVLTN